jgi:hypothetical protein
VQKKKKKKKKKYEVIPRRTKIEYLTFPNSRRKFILSGKEEKS